MTQNLDKRHETEPYQLSREHACRFLLMKHGLYGENKFIGKQGVLDFIRQVGCIQFDPVDVCGRNADLVLHSRVKGYTKKMLYELLYEDRELIDYFDKNLSIISISDWKYFSRGRKNAENYGHSKAEIEAVRDDIKEFIKKNGPVCSSDLDHINKGAVKWYWSDTKLARAALEDMYFRGELIIHHKKRTRKFYDLAENIIPREILSEPDPYPDDFAHTAFRVLRRISGVGMLWNKPSDAWLNIPLLKAEQRNEVFKHLLHPIHVSSGSSEQKIIALSIEGIKDMMYCHSADAGLIALSATPTDDSGRCELIAPLDNMLWDRKLIKALFGFEYKWEIYTPEAKRKYGHYVLPILYGEKFIGRVEAVYSSKDRQLDVRNIWYEEGVKPTKKIKSLLDKSLQRLENLNRQEN